MVGLLVMVAGLFAPVDADNLPPPMDGTFGEPAASAQTGQTGRVISGTADPCPAVPIQWSSDSAGECSIEMGACPESPLPSRAGKFLVMSHNYGDIDGVVLFPGFCEERESDIYPAPFNECENQPLSYTTSFGSEVVLVRKSATTPMGESLCRLLTIPMCEAGLHRAHVDVCRAVKRRTWNCPAGSIHRNAFNTCYVLPAGLPTGPHPACGGGRPAFPVLSCEDYVADDYLHDPAAKGCDEYLMQDNPTIGSSAEHWCQFDATLLELECHKVGTHCVEDPSYCLKRASETGGCDAAAAAIVCRELQSDLDRGLAEVGEVLAAGCSPCPILPFRPVPTGPQCRSFRAEPQQPTRETTRNGVRYDMYEVIHRVKQDWDILSYSCTEVFEYGMLPTEIDTCVTWHQARGELCPDPPAGGLHWQTERQSSVALVNSPIVLTIEDVPYRRVRQTNPAVSKFSHGYIFKTQTHEYLHYGSHGEAGLSRVRTWKYRDHHLGDTLTAQIDEECFTWFMPSFRVSAEEIWPDVDADAIRELFGNNSLDWWDALSLDEQQSRTQDRGLEWIDVSDPAAAAQREARRAELTEEADCNSDGRSETSFWCRWTPTRPGYYRLTAGGAWLLKNASLHGWVNNSVRTGIELKLTEELNDPANVDPHYNHNRVLTDLGLTYEEAGFEVDAYGYPTGRLSDPTNTDTFASDELYFGASVLNSGGCQPQDYRITRCGTGTVANYTETEPIGIEVNEIRVRTVAPTR